jgi:hypothetical protein
VGLPAGKLLELVLGQLDLAYEVEYGIVKITTPSVLEKQLRLRVHDVRDLLAAKWSEADGVNLAAVRVRRLKNDARELSSLLREKPDEAFKQSLIVAELAHQTLRSSPEASLIEIITATIQPDTWDENGGAGSVRFYKGALIISTTPGVHREIERLLADLGKVTRDASTDASDERHSAGRGTSGTDELDGGELRGLGKGVGISADGPGDGERERSGKRADINEQVEAQPRRTDE